jgi:hypothetical protein
MMARQELEEVWVSRIGSTATEELLRYRRSGFFVMAMPVVAGAAGVLIGTSTLGDVLGAVLAAVVAWYLAAFIHAQRRLAAALSEWFGVKIKGLPKMNPKRFDAWCQERGLRSPREGLASGQAADALDTAQGAHDSSSSSTA